ncbi:MAG: DUF1772 domain-containing protein [Rhizobacter sp.]|nr:DUF1772 domain-containing protein [Rhizobacter sp.]
MAGIFFAFSNFVMKALLQQPPESGARAMQAINVLILNPVFFVVFMGTALATAFIAFVSVSRLSQGGALLLLASALYLLGSFGVTILFNVPLNNRLAGHGEGTPEAARFWPDYAARWLKWNHVRTLASLAATVLLAWAMWRHDLQLGGAL